MSYRHVGSAFGREIFVTGEPDPQDTASPQGYSVAAVVLREGWTSDELGWLLNGLYGALDDWTEFNPDAGARSFVFYGERAEEASNLSDTFAYAWTKGVEAQYDDVISSSNDAPDIDAFVEAMLTGEIAVGDAYADKLQNLLFSVLMSDPAEQPDRDREKRVASAVESAVRQRHFD